jgi:hypothetical protein
MVAVPITGTDGSIEVDSTPVENMQEWSYKPEANIIEGMGGYGSDWDMNAAGLLKGSGSCKGVFATGATGQAALETAFYARQLVVLNLAATSGGTPLSINARIANLQITMPNDDKSEWSFDYTQYGAPISQISH